jgi:Ca2+-binding RTX toxin-like protein
MRLPPRSWSNVLARLGLRLKASPSRQPRRVLHAEALEPRQMLAITAAFASGQLEVFGDSGNNSISVGYQLDGSTPYASVNGMLVGASGGWANGFYDALEADDVTDLRVYAYEGNDEVNLSGVVRWAYTSMGAGNIRVDGHEGNDTLYGSGYSGSGGGSGFDDALFGGDGNDSLYGRDDADWLEGGAGSDYISGDDGDDTIYGNADSDLLIGGAGNDTLYGNGGNDTIDGGDGYDFGYGGDGSDDLHGGNDPDYLVGEGGNDYCYGDADYDQMFGGLGDDYIEGGDGNDWLYGDEGLAGNTGGNDVIYGQDGEDHVYGEGGDDGCYGDSSDDDADANYGGAGNDFFDLGLYDTFEDDPGYSFYLGTLTINGTLGADTLSITHASGNIKLNGTTIASAASVTAIIVYGGDANDVISFGSLPSGIAALTAYGGDGNDQIGTTSGNAPAHLYGGAGNDALTGNGTGSELNGEDGSDSLNGSGEDHLDGGAGNDRFFLATASNADTSGDDLYYLYNLESALIADSNGLNDVYSSILDGSNEFTYELEDDELTLVGITGVQLVLSTVEIDSTVYLAVNNFAILPANLVATISITGTSGADYIDLSALDPEDIDLLSTTITTLGGDDIVFGSFADDEITGGDGDDLIYGGDSDDELNGGDGNDVLIGDLGHDKLSGGAGADSLTGGGGDDDLYGGAGNDVLHSDSGYDWLFGEEDDDQIFVQSIDDRFHDDQGVNTIHTPDGNTGICSYSGYADDDGTLACLPNSEPEEQDTFVVVLDVYQSSDCDCDVVPPPPPTPRFVLAEEDKAWLDDQRSEWLPNMLNPTVPSSAYSYNTFLGYIENAELALDRVHARQEELEAIVQDSNATKQDFLDQLKSVLYAYDAYLYEYQEVLLVEAQFADAQWLFDAADQALVMRANNLPATINGLEEYSTQEQLDAILANIQQFSNVMQDQLDSYDFTVGALQGVRDTAFVAVVGLGAVAILPGAVSFALGAGVLSLGAGISASNRVSQDQETGEVLLGTFTDVTGINQLSLGIYGVDAGTGDPVALEPEARGYAFGTGISQLLLNLVVPGAQGGSTQLTLPMPRAVGGGFLPNFGGTGVMRPVGWTFQGVPIAAMPTSVIATSVTVGSTNVMVLMRKLSRDAEDTENLSTTPGARTSHDVGVSEGRNYVQENLNLQQTDFVNPFEDWGAYGQGFDDIMVDANGDYWICEWKGGSAGLADGQMESGWVTRNIQRLLDDAPWNPWGARLRDALANSNPNSPRLRGIAVKTECANGEVGDTLELGRWQYSP